MLDENDLALLPVTIIPPRFLALALIIEGQEAAGDVKIYMDENQLVDFIDAEGQEFKVLNLNYDQLFAESVSKIDFIRPLSASSGDGAKDPMAPQQPRRGPLAPAVDHLRQASDEVTKLVRLLHAISADEAGKQPTLMLEHIIESSTLSSDAARRSRDLPVVMAFKRKHLKEVASIFSKGSARVKENSSRIDTFFKYLLRVRSWWKLKAILHGPAYSLGLERERRGFERIKDKATLKLADKKPLRAGDPLAVDCSYSSAGSNFHEFNKDLIDESEAEITVESSGSISVKFPPAHVGKTILIKLSHMSVNESNRFPQDRVVDTVVLFLNDGRMKGGSMGVTGRGDGEGEIKNDATIEEIQHTLFCSELFYHLREEAFKVLRDGHSRETYVTKASRDSIALNLDDAHVLQVSLEPLSRSSTAPDKSCTTVPRSHYLFDTATATQLYMKLLLRKFHKRDHSKDAFEGETPSFLKSLSKGVGHYLFTRKAGELLEGISRCFGQSSSSLTLDGSYASSITENDVAINWGDLSNSLYSTFEVLYGTTSAASVVVADSHVYMQGARVSTFADLRNIVLHRVIYAHLLQIDLLVRRAGFQTTIVRSMGLNIVHSMDIFPQALPLLVGGDRLSISFSVIDDAISNSCSFALKGVLQLSPTMTNDKRMVGILADGKGSVDWTKIPGKYDGDKILWIMETARGVF